MKRTANKRIAKPAARAQKSRRGAGAAAEERPHLRQVVFLAANASYSHTNLAGWYLRAFTADLGWQWRTVDLVVGEEPYPAFNRMADAQPDVIAATFYAFNSNCLLSLIRRHKAVYPSCVVIAGGPEFLGDNREFLARERCIDLAIRGEGESAFRDLLSSFQFRDKWRDIKGFCGFADGQYVDNGMAATVENLDSIPSPYNRLATGHFKKPFIQIESSRGCFSDCGFCASGGTGTRYFSDERVCSDLNLIRKAGIRHVKFVDRTFNDKSSRAAKLIKTLRDEFKDLNFHLEIDPSRLTQEVLDALEPARQGQFHMDVGVQTFDGAVLEHCGRGASPKKTLAGMKALCKMPSVEVHADLIAGLPNCTLKQTVSDLEKLAALRPAEIQLELLKLLPGTRLATERDKFGLVASPEPPYEVLRTGAMTTGDLLAALWLSRMVDWFYGTEGLRSVVQQASEAMENFWLALADFCRGRQGLWMKPSLVNRFKLLHEFFTGRDRKCLMTLQYAWMKQGLGPDDSLCRAEPWGRPIPDYAVFIEGNKGASIFQTSLARLDRTYIFGYGHQRSMGAVAVFSIPDSVAEQ